MTGDGPVAFEQTAELDDAEEAEVVPATVAELVEAITGTPAGPDAKAGRFSPRPAGNGGLTAACSEAWWSPRR